ncbi:MAG: hypothetical protein ICV83_01975, partial [Cytophagales bacterium]|nr:hypothetical protein [Cytophagales bacterium]
LSSAKVRLEAGMQELENELAAIKADADSLGESMTQVNRLLTRREAALRRLQTLNTRLEAYRDTAQTQLSGLQQDQDRLAGENQLLANQGNALKDEVATLQAQLRTVRSALTADAFRVEARKRNDKATAKAKKVHTLTISFLVPAELRTEGEKEVYLSLTNLQDNVPLTPLRTAAVPVVGGRAIPVHAVERVPFGKDLQRITFTLQPAEDLPPGTYRASVFTDDTYLGAVEFSFRDSFWFF